MKSKIAGAPPRTTRRNDTEASPVQQTFVQWSQPYTYDNGSLSSVGISDNGTVLEVHNGPDGDDGMYYRIGSFTTAPSPDLSTSIQWQPTYPNGIGDGNPISADVNDQFAVQVYQDSDKNLFFQWAPLPANEQGELAWSPGDNYTSGEQPAIAVNNGSQVVAVHQDSKIFSSSLWYATGAAGAAMGEAAEILQPDGSSISGNFLQVAMNDQGTVAIAYRGDFLPRSNLAQLFLIAGTIQPNGGIVFGEQFTSTILVNGNFDIALDNEGNLLILCATSDLGKDYLGWIVGTVENNIVTVPADLPLPLNFVPFLADDVTVAMNNSGNLIAETGASGGPPPPFQYFVGQAYFNEDYSHWMGDNLALIGDIPLNLVALPGTHDSGTFPITASSEISPDNPSTVLSTIAPAVASGWAQAQDLSFLDQLNAGIRYLDLRVCYQSAQNAYLLCHGFYGAALSALFSDVQAFYQQGPAYASEIILLDMNHIYTDSPGAPNWGGGSFWMPGGPAGEFPALCQFINSGIGSLLLPPSLNGKSLNQIIASPEYQAGGRVILLFDDTYSLTQNPAYWPNVDSNNLQYWQTVDNQTTAVPGIPPAITSPWPDVSTLPALVSASAVTLQQTLLPAWSAWLEQGTPPGEFVVLQNIGTEGTPQIEAGVLNEGPPDLQSWEAGICSPSMFWLAAQPNAVAANIVLVDWLEQTTVTPFCIALNQRKAAAMTGSAREATFTTVSRAS